MKQQQKFLFPVLLVFVCMASFIPPQKAARPTANTINTTDELKAWWYSYYFKNSNTMYISNVYNNDCNHCENEIKADFKKWLTMNDYDNSPNGANIQSIHSIDEKSAGEKREETIYKYKQKGYSVSKVGYRYAGER